MTHHLLNEEFKKLARSKVRSGPFKSVAIYNDQNDSLEILISEEDYRRERVDKFLTLYRGRDSGDVVGAMIRSVRRRFLKEGEYAV